MAEIKEPNFFSQLDLRIIPVVHDEAKYLRLFAPGADRRYRGEASPSYLWHEAVPAALKRVSPEARIVISLRDPVDRAHSSFWQGVRDGYPSLSFQEAMEAEIADPQEWPRSVRSGFYADGVARYLELFPGAVHVLFFEDFVRDAQHEMRRIFEFLGVDAAVAERLEDEASNAFGIPRNPLSRTVLRSPRIRAAARAVVPPALRPRLYQKLLSPAQKPPLPADVEELLIAHYAADVERLRALLRLDPPWPRFTGTARRPV